MTNQNIKRAISLALVVGMFASVSPTAILAAETEGIPSQPVAQATETAQATGEPEANDMQPETTEIPDTEVPDEETELPPVPVETTTPEINEDGSFVVDATKTVMPYIPEEGENVGDLEIVDETNSGAFEELKDDSVLETVAEEQTAMEMAASSNNVYDGFTTDPETGEPAVDESGYITSTFGYPVAGDPYERRKMKVNDTRNGAYYLTDRDFFGVWDENKQEWTTVGKLNYEGYPNLADVEDAVKRGDYEEAKNQIYLYYIEKEKEIAREKDISSSAKDKLTADLLTENFMYNGNSGLGLVPNLMKVGNEQKYYDVDVTSVITPRIGLSNEITLWVEATNKDGDEAIFNSREAGDDTRPYLRLKINGTERILYATADMYISAGSNTKKSFGKESQLIAREDPEAPSNTLVTEKTCRIYLKFDFSSVVKGDTIEAATLNLYGNNSVEGKEKDLVIFYTSENKWTENSYWGTGGDDSRAVIQQLIFSYDQMESWPWNQPSNSGYRYPEELLRFNTYMDKLIKLYNYTGDEKYAYTFFRLLSDFINVRGAAPEHIKTLDVALRTQVVPGYVMQLINSKYMTPELFITYMKYMYVEAHSSKKYTTSNNWASSETMGLYSVAVNYPEFTDSPQWISHCESRYTDILNPMMADDYSCTELSIGYVDYTLDTAMGARVLADKVGIKDYPYSERTLEVIHGLGKFILYASTPNRGDMQVGDGYSHTGNFKSRLLKIAQWFNDEELYFGAGESGKEPEFTSHLFPTGKKAVMRSSWDEDALYLFTDVDGGKATPNRGGSHAHPDDNSIVVQAYGQYLLADPLYGTYSASTAKTWLTSTIAHNTVIMNDKNSANGSQQGTIERWETNEAYDFLAANSPNTKDASSFVRKTLFVRPFFWIVSDYLVPNNSSSNKYTQAWHFLPNAKIELDEYTKATNTNFTDVNISVVPVTAPGEIGNEDPSQDTFKSEIVLGLYSEGQGSVSDAYYTEYTRNGTGNMIFNTVLFPTDAGQEYDVSTSMLELEGLTDKQASAFEIYAMDKIHNTTDRYVYFVLHDMSKKGTTVKFGDYETDASMLFMEVNTDGSASKVIAQDASFVKNTDKALDIFKSDEAMPEISFEYSGENCKIDASTIAYEDLQENNVLMDSKSKYIKSCILNWEPVSFHTSGTIVYFGDGPDDPGSTATPTVKPTTKPSHGGGGGGGGGSIQTAKPSATPTVTATPTAAPTATPTATVTPVATMSPELAQELEGHWAQKEITELYNEGIVKGQTETSFGLDNQITRSEFITLMVRALDLEVPAYEGEFTDVSSDDWYAGYIQAAYDNGLITGFNGMASPNASITREEMAKILAQAAAMEDLEPGASADQGQFTDSDQISGWAADSVVTASKLGLIQGMDDGSFAPKAQTKRSEAFVVTYRLLDQIAANTPQEENPAQDTQGDEADPALAPEDEEASDGEETSDEAQGAGDQAADDTDKPENGASGDRNTDA